MTGDREVVVASMNAHGGRSAHGMPFDLEAACHLFRADIIGLQEAWRTDGEPDPIVEIARGLGAQALRDDLVTGTSLRKLNIATETACGRWGLALLTTLPVVGCEVVWLGRTPGDHMPRAAQLVTVEVGGNRLRIANAHLTHRGMSPVQLLSLVRRLATSDVPTVIVGDLNMPGPVTGLAASYRLVVSGRTFPANLPLVQLDHVLAGRGVTGRYGEVLPPAGSDHLPIRARLCLT